MPDQITTGYQGALYFGDGETYATSTTWTEVTQLEDVQPPETEVTDLPTRHLKTPDQYETFKGSWANPGEVEATVQYTPTQYAAIAALIRQDKGWKVLFADDTTAGTHDGGIGFSGYVKKLGTPFEADGIVKFTFAIKVSGKPTIIAADSTPGS